MVLGVAFFCGVVAAGVFFRRQVKALVARAVPYVRARSSIETPALIVNRWSGDGRAERIGLLDAAAAAGLKTILLERGDDLAQLAHDAISAGADAIGMAGGDGSLGIVAGVAVERGVPFFCVPVGTRNHFALDLGLDREEPLTALDALRDGDELRIDYATAGDRIFLNNVSFGVYAQAVHREGYRENKEKTIAKELSDIAGRSEAQAAVRYVTPDGEHHERAPLLLVSNNRYQMTGPPDFGRRYRMDSGKLGVGAVTSLPAGKNVAALRLAQVGALHEWETTSIRLESNEPILAGLDGEAVEFASPLDISIQPKGLRVLVPAGTRPGYVPVGETVAARLLDMAELGGRVS
jgi:diacylglycerol kinase family enzyme